LVDIGGKPILWHIMKIYSHYGFNNFILCLGYKGHMIKQYFLNYEKFVNDFTINLRSRKINFENDIEEDWNITLVDTGAETNTGGRIKKLRNTLKMIFLWLPMVMELQI